MKCKCNLPQRGFPLIKRCLTKTHRSCVSRDLNVVTKRVCQTLFLAVRIPLHAHGTHNEKAKYSRGVSAWKKGGGSPMISKSGDWRRSSSSWRTERSSGISICSTGGMMSRWSSCIRNESAQTGFVQAVNFRSNFMFKTLADS